MLQLDNCGVVMHQSISGIYVVIAELPRAMNIQIGRRKKAHFEAGFYGYVGSALGGLEKRLARHLSNRKRLHWHIDYLLNVATVRAFIYAETSQRKECLVAQVLSRKLNSQPDFGCSDCDCRSHLFFCQDPKDLNEAVLDSFILSDLNPSKIEGGADIKIHQRR
jgi:Uri superfamily endonuclease